MRPLLFLTFLFLVSASLSAQTLTITLSGIRSSSGFIRMHFYANPEGFDKEKPLFTKLVSKVALAEGVLKVSYTGIKQGTYGIAALDDENSNEKMDYGLILPKEGFGFSDYYHTGMTRPKFSDFDFVVGSENKSIVIRLRYL